MGFGNCPIHGHVEAYGNYCSVCWYQGNVQTYLDILEDSRKAMENLDGERQPLSTPIPSSAEWDLKKGNSLMILPYSLVALILMALPFIVVETTGAHWWSYILGAICFPGSVFGIVLFTWWWLRTYLAGGVPSLKEELKCQYSYEYYEEIESTKRYFGLLSKLKRARSATTLECIRFTVCQLIMVGLFIGCVALYFEPLVFSSSSNSTRSAPQLQPLIQPLIQPFF